MQYALGVVPGLTVEMFSPTYSIIIKYAVRSRCSSRPNGRDGRSTLSVQFPAYRQRWAQYALSVVPGLQVEMGAVHSRQFPAYRQRWAQYALGVVPGLSVEMGTVCSQCSSWPNGRDGRSTLSVQFPAYRQRWTQYALDVVLRLSVEMGTVRSRCSSRPIGRDGHVRILFILFDHHSLTNYFVHFLSIVQKNYFILSLNYRLFSIYFVGFLI